MKRPDLSKRNKTHGMSHLPEYNVWCGMKQRCYYKKHKTYDKYGGKGIKICDRWLDFKNFYEDMGPRPPKMTIERIDVNGDYTPENCRWATRSEQMKNTTRTHFIEHNGIRLCLTDWAKKLNVTYALLATRAYKGYTDEQILFGKGIVR